MLRLPEFTYHRPKTVAKAVHIAADHGKELTDEVIAAAGTAAMKPARTMDNPDLDVYWRRKVAPVFVARALMACR